MLGVCGGIAAYKAVELCRRLVDDGAFVSPVLTAGAERFVTSLTFSAVASEPARTDLWDSAAPSPHTRLGRAADLVVVAPATANLLGAYAAGLATDLLTATLLATTAPVVVCPAMHTEMWEHPAVRDNMATLRHRGVEVVGPMSGHLAGGDVGLGRMAEPPEIVDAVRGLLAPGEGALAGVRALVTAGGTREPIDPVRFVGNRSSGKQGYALAAELARRGAAVTLVTTVSLPPPPGVEVTPVETAAEMEAAVLARADADVVVMAAAVADFRPKEAASNKLKKTDGVPQLLLEETTDILAELGRRHRPGQVVVGFAAETAGGEDLQAYAEAKLRAKRADLIVANDVSAPGAGFSHDTNAVLIVSADNRVEEVPISTKSAVASAVADAVVAYRERLTEENR